ncbi:MAG: APC family permease, partial [Limisphaerales bacterium]
KRGHQIGLWSATALVVASMVGTGVFTTSGFLLADLHSKPLVLCAWAVGGIVAVFGAVCYGALARKIPESGGEYLFLARTLHPAAGYLAGWVSLMVGFSAPLAAAAVAFGEYTQAWFGGLDPRLLGSFLLLVFSVAHGWELRAGALVQNLSVLLKLLFLLTFLVLGTTKLQIHPEPDLRPTSVGAFAVSLVWISFSYSGWNAAIYLSSEIRDAARNVPRAMLLGTTAVLLLYLALNALMIFSVPTAAFSGQLEVGKIAARQLGGTSWENAITAIIALALATSVSSLIMSGPRVYARMAVDGYLPQWLYSSAAHFRPAIAFQSAIALVLLWTATFKTLLTYIGFTLSLSTAAAVVGLIKLRRKEGKTIQVRGWPWVPLLFIAFVLFAAVFTVLRQPFEAALGGATLLLGLLAYRYQAGSAKDRGK